MVAKPQPESEEEQSRTPVMSPLMASLLLQQIGKKRLQRRPRSLFKSCLLLTALSLFAALLAGFCVALAAFVFRAVHDVLMELLP